MDRARLERDLRAVADLLLTVAPPQLVNLDLSQLTAKLGPMGQRLMQLAGMPTSGTWDLRATLYGACGAIAALPDEQLRSVLSLIAWELDALRDPNIERSPATPTPAEWDAIAAVLNAIRGAVA